jgi:D-xylose transport system ATP-binding protein
VTPDPHREAQAPPAVVELQDVTVDFPGVRALDHVSVRVHAGRVHALVGENGAGKSTLIRVVGGVYARGTYEGELCVDGRPVRFRSPADAEHAGIAVIHQELALVPHLSVAENLFLGRQPSRFGMVDQLRLHRGASAVLQRLGLRVDPRTLVSDLGMGQRQLVEIGKALQRRGRILVLDEPSAALADEEVQRLLSLVRELRDQGVAIVYISHKLDEVMAIADTVTVLRDGQLVRTAPVGEWTREGLVSAMVGREMETVGVHGARTPGDVALEVEDLCLDDRDRPGHLRLHHVSFRVRAGEILGIAGLMGAGRTELVNTLFGAAPAPWRGTVKVGGRPVSVRGPRDAIRAGMALVPEDRKDQGLVLPFETLSGGNQQKVVIGKWLVRPPRILFLDEPTRGIDVGAKAEIHALIDRLTRAGMAVVLVSSELPEILAVCDRVLVLRDGRLAAEFDRADATPEAIMGVAT